MRVFNFNGLVVVFGRDDGNVDPHTRADGALFMQKGLPSMAIPRLCDRG
ncbi:MAG: hypothetical protein P8X74_17690 [Reinekea sp.]